MAPRRRCRCDLDALGGSRARRIVRRGPRGPRVEAENSESNNGLFSATTPDAMTVHVALPLLVARRSLLRTVHHPPTQWQSRQLSGVKVA